MLSDVVAEAVKKMMQAVTPMIVNISSGHMELHTRTEKFFVANEDLEPYRPFVGFVANQLSAKHPEWTYGKLFEELGDNNYNDVDLMS